MVDGWNGLEGREGCIFREVEVGCDAFFVFKYGAVSVFDGETGWWLVDRMTEEFLAFGGKGDRDLTFAHFIWPVVVGVDHAEVFREACSSEVGSSTDADVFTTLSHVVDDILATFVA